MIAQWYREHGGPAPRSRTLALIGLGVVAAGALVVVAIARTLDRLLPDELATDADASRRRGRRLPRVADP
jgi:hypothetical protein